MVEAGRQFHQAVTVLVLCWRKVEAEPEPRWVRARADVAAAGQGRREPACTAPDPEPESKGIFPYGEERRSKARSCKQRRVLAVM